MSAARPLSSLLSAGAVLALALAAPGTALADPGNAGGKGAGGQSAGQAEGKGAGGQSGGGNSGGERADAGQPADGSGAAPARAAEPKPAAEPAKDKPAQSKPAQSKPAKDKPAKDKPAKDKPAKDKPAHSKPAQSKPAQSKPARSKPATQPAPPQPAAPAPDAGAASPAAAGSGDPAGNNGTIKIDTVPGDADRANRPHPGCAFVVQFFGFDAGQTADITFTGQAPTRSAGPLLTLSGRTISTTPADGALEEGHSLTLTAADLGLVGTPTAAKGWHVKVDVDALEAPGGAKSKVFWLDCSTDAATVTPEPDDVTSEPGTEGSTATGPAVVGAAGKDAGLRSVQLEQPATGAPAAENGLAVLSGSATREAAGSGERGAAGTSGEAGAATGDVSAAAQVADGAQSSTRPSALPFTGPAGLAAMLAAGLGAVGAGALALRAGRRRTAASTASAASTD